MKTLWKCVLLVALVAACVTTLIHTQTQTPAGAPPETKAAKTESNWHQATGQVVSTDLSKNMLLLRSEGKELRLTVPGRVSMLALKPGDRVIVQYIEERGKLRVWSLAPTKPRAKSQKPPKA